MSFSAATPAGAGPIYHPVSLDDAENLEKYVPGGYHPVELGEIYHDCYKIIHKLGYGGFSTVWLARDSVNSHYVALKLVCATASANYASSPEIKAIVDDESSLYLVKELQRFHFAGPNGHHLCQVFPAMGPSLLHLSGSRYRLFPRACRALACRAANILKVLHDKGCCHGG